MAYTTKTIGIVAIRTWRGWGRPPAPPADSSLWCREWRLLPWRLVLL